MDPIIAGYENIESIKSKENLEKKRELTPEEDDFAEAMNNMPPFAGTEMAAAAGVAAVAPLEIADNIAQPDTEGEGPEETKANGEGQTTPASVVEQVARDHIERGDTDPDTILQDAGAMIGREAVKNTNLEVNSTIAQNAAENINPQNSDGAEQALNLLTETGATTAVAKAKAEDAAIKMVNESPDASTSKVEAEEAITEAESAVETLDSTVSKITPDDPSIAAKVVSGASNARETLQEARDLLTAEVDKLAAEQDATEEKTPELSTPGETTPEEGIAGAESIAAIGATPGASGDILNSAPNSAETSSVAPGEMNADTVRMLQQKREDEKKKAVEAALKAQNESAPKEQLEGRQSF